MNETGLFTINITITITITITKFAFNDTKVDTNAIKSTTLLQRSRLNLLVCLH